MHRLNVAIIVALAALSAVLIAGSPASAICAAATDNPKRAPDAVFEGTVVDRTDSSVTFHVDTVYKGSVFETETLAVSGFEDDTLAFIRVGAHALVEGTQEGWGGRISVPMCARWDAASWSYQGGHPPTSGVLGRILTHPFSLFTIWCVIVVALTVKLGRAAWRRYGPHARVAASNAP